MQVGRPDRDAVTGLDAQCDQPAGNTSALLGELRVAQALVAIDDGLVIGPARGSRLDNLGQGSGQANWIFAHVTPRYGNSTRTSGLVGSAWQARVHAFSRSFLSSTSL